MGEGNDEEDTRGDRRVDEVVTESAEHLLDDNDRERGADDDHVRRKGYGKVHGKEKTGNDCGQIVDRVVSLHDLPADILEKHT